MGYFTKELAENRGVGFEKRAVRFFRGARRQDSLSRQTKSPASTAFHAVVLRTTAPGVPLYGYRHLCPKLGRWVSMDPLGEETFISQHLVSMAERLRQKAINNRAFVRFYPDLFDIFIQQRIALIKMSINAKSLFIYQFVINNPAGDVDLFGLDNLGKGGQNVVCCVTFGPTDPIGNVGDNAETAEQLNFPGIPDPYGGAYRHCVAACLLHRNYGSLAGRILRCLWDIIFEDDSANSQTDMIGEDWGEHLAGASIGTCADACLVPYPPYIPPPTPPQPSGPPAYIAPPLQPHPF